MDKHDSHYKRTAVSEPIEIIEDLMVKHWHRASMPPEAAYSLGNAVKYVLRAGLKQGQDYKKDLEKAMNYLNRAISGEWL